MTFSAVAFDYFIYLKMLFNFRNEIVYYGDASPHQPQTTRERFAPHQEGLLTLADAQDR